MSRVRPKVLARRIIWSIAILFAGGALIPYAIIGESWGLLWFYFTAPVSMAVEATIGIGKSSYLLILLTTLACAAGWAIIAYAFTRLIQRGR